MKKEHYLIIGVLFILGVFIIWWYAQQINSCEKLAKNLDKKIVDTNNPSGRFIISGYTGMVGGTLINIKNNGQDRNSNSYTLTFKGINSEGNLYLITSSNSELPYKIGQFYRFDLKNKNQYSAAVSGSFIDHELDKLTPISC